jgi:hypothetical protein
VPRCEVVAAVVSCPSTAEGGALGPRVTVAERRVSKLYLSLAIVSG